MNSENTIRSSLNSLITFHGVAKHKSFSKAAEELFISQPAVTKHIRNLELKIGVRLIRRGRGEFALTEAGKILYRHTQKISSHLMEIENVLGTLQKDRHGFLRIGTTESYSKCLMPKLLSGFQTSFPAIKISLDVGNSEEIARNLSTYQNDLAVIGMTKVPSQFESIPFLKEELVLIVPPRHPLSRRKSVSLKELEGYPLIIRAKGSTTRRLLLQAFKELEVCPSLMVEANSSEFIKQWVSEGRGVSVIVNRIVEDEGKRGTIRIVPLAEKLCLDVFFLYLKEQRLNPAIRTFVGYMEEKGRRIVKT
ncbi:MAG: LysR substrate-binding domain-containing protein [Thermodesulfobacteriota bacterium]